MLDYTLWHTLELVGVCVFALSGAISASEEQFDLSGVFVVALIVGHGGGSIRDMLLGNTPVLWLDNPNSLIATLIITIAFIACNRFIRFASTSLLVVDALGLGVFAITGTHIAVTLEMSSWVAVVMGVITGVGGGFIRDLITRTPPMVLRREVYALAALAGSVLFVLLPRNEAYELYTALGCVLIIILVRLASLRWNWHLPILK